MCFSCSVQIVTRLYRKILCMRGTNKRTAWQVPRTQLVMHNIIVIIALIVLSLIVIFTFILIKILLAKLFQTITEPDRIHFNNLRFFWFLCKLLGLQICSSDSCTDIGHFIQTSLSEIKILAFQFLLPKRNTSGRLINKPLVTHMLFLMHSLNILYVYNQFKSFLWKRMFSFSYDENLVKMFWSIFTSIEQDIHPQPYI